jgi:hypothetical protein
MSSAPVPSVQSINGTAGGSPAPRRTGALAADPLRQAEQAGSVELPAGLGPGQLAVVEGDVTGAG